MSRRPAGRPALRGRIWKGSCLGPAERRLGSGPGANLEWSAPPGSIGWLRCRHDLLHRGPLRRRRVLGRRRRLQVPGRRLRRPGRRRRRRRHRHPGDANVAYKGRRSPTSTTGATASVALQRLLEEDDGPRRPPGRASSTSTAAPPPTPATPASTGPAASPATATRSRATSWPATDVVAAMQDAFEAPTPTSRWPAGCSPRWPPATTPAATAAAGSRRRCSWSARAPGTAAATTSRSTCASTTTRTRHRAGPAARPQRPLPDRLHRGRAGRRHRRAAATSSRSRRTALGRSTTSRLGRHRELRDAGRARRAWIDQQILEHRSAATRRHERPRDRRRHHRRHRARRRPPTAAIAAKGYQEFAQHFPRPGWVEHAPEEIWQADARGRPRRRSRRSTPRADGGRDHQPARDRPALGPRDARLAAPGDRLAGPADRRDLRRGCATRATRSGSPS